MIRMLVEGMTPNVPRSHNHCVIEKTGTRVTVSRCPITIPFDYMLKRTPEIPKETDIRLEKHNLIDMASSVWAAQED